MDKYDISIRAFESIIKNLVKLEEEQDIIVECFAKSAIERAEMIHILENYIKTIDQFLIVANKKLSLDRKLPFATIGSEIEVEEISNQIHHTFRLVSALEERLAYGDVSFLSPLGTALLLKRPGNIVELAICAGKTRYKIISINAII